MLDRGFGIGGEVVTDLGADDYVLSVVTNADGEIVAAGKSGRDPNSGEFDFALARYTRHGALDRSFGRGGKVVTDLGSDDIAFAVLVQANGEIVAAGTRGSSTGKGDFALVRYTKAGALDRSFGRSGKVVTDLGSNDEASGAALQATGAIVLAGTRGSDSKKRDIALIRYTGDGVLDQSFGHRGKMLTDLGADDNAYAVVVQRDAKIVVAGRTGPGPSRRDYDFALLRYTKGGSLDRSFGRDGKVLTDLGSDDHALAVAVQADGRIVAAGMTGTDFAVVRYLAK